MIELTCAECEKEFTVEDAPFGDNVICPYCKTELETDMEESYEGCTFWVTDKVNHESK